MLSVIYAECRNKPHYAECRYAECRGALFFAYIFAFELISTSIHANLARQKLRYNDKKLLKLLPKLQKNSFSACNILNMVRQCLDYIEQK
jgi:hypothetical protein